MGTIQIRNFRVLLFADDSGWCQAGVEKIKLEELHNLKRFAKIESFGYAPRMDFNNSEKNSPH